tara:strand:- start:31 stop:249 length:219 start_codon:yes stop_codon:yes gene_type:complete
MELYAEYGALYESKKFELLELMLLVVHSDNQTWGALFSNRDFVMACTWRTMADFTTDALNGGYKLVRGLEVG